MPRVAKPLGAATIKNLTAPGLHAVGHVNGLRLSVKATGARSWVLRTTVNARRAELGLGSYPTVSLAMAIERARAALDQIRDGVDPAQQRRDDRAIAPWTFKRCAEHYIAAHRASWRNAKHAQQWENTLASYAYPLIGHKHVGELQERDVLQVISPHWTTKNETMVRLRNRIERVIAWATQKRYRPRELPNPASWRGNLEFVLPRPAKVNNRQHFEAIPVDAMPGFFARLQAVEGMSARALEFAILTASRTGAVRLAEWPEIDLEAAVWTCPKEHMKSGRQHRVPLSAPAVKLLKALPHIEGESHVFPGRSGALSDMSLTQTMRRMGTTAVPHGCRSTFSDWCAERTATPAEVREMALAHAIGDATEEAYRRGDLFEKRRELMAAWAMFVCASVPKVK